MKLSEVQIWIDREHIGDLHVIYRKVADGYRPYLDSWKTFKDFPNQTFT